MSTLENLNKELQREREKHHRTRQELRTELERVWRLVPTHYISLMGVYPPLRKLLHVLAEAADLQDPTKGAAYEDTMRTEYTPDGETLTQTESGVIHHQAQRAHVVTLSKDLQYIHKKIRNLLDDKTHDMAHLTRGEAWEYSPPDGKCEECKRLLFQSPTGRRKSFCSARCRQAASRKARSKP